MLRYLLILPVSISIACAGSGRADDSINFGVELKSSEVTRVDYHMSLEGEISTPGESGEQKFPIVSRGDFEFQHRVLSSGLPGAAAVSGVRLFEVARTETTVDKTNNTRTALPATYRLIHLRGNDDGLTCFHGNYLLPRPQLDLMQMPFDPLAVRFMLPSDEVKVGDKWNFDDWVLPMLTGLTAAVEQKGNCRLKSLNAEEAIVLFQGSVNGAVSGSAANANVSAEIRFSRKTGRIVSVRAQQKEKRTAGPVSPGLNVTANIRWNQAEQKSPAQEIQAAKQVPTDPALLQLVLELPSRLKLRHSREWFVFHQTPAVLMLRQLRSGRLISQCNISSAVTVAPGQHMPDAEFLADVKNSVAERKGRVVDGQTIRDDSRWRVRKVTAAGDASGSPIVWDYYLCTAKSGEQFSLVFSHAVDVGKEFGNEADKILSTLEVAKRR